MAIFPLRFRPKESYHEHPRCFGNAREGGHRSHAGCDLYGLPGTDILAVEDGVVLRTGYQFYLSSVAIDIQHASGVIRYCELGQISESLKIGSTVRAGQVIAKIGQLKGLPLSMLHLEMYTGNASGPLSNFQVPPYERRKDLMDPTPFLDACELWSEPPAVLAAV
jgi:murein DD-endopeptidase MepM/ murein hydrolase activator NlpD